jgi:flavin reductase (DIM6/NTAB) family NADH-FMN oxidoreductase RutF
MMAAVDTSTSPYGSLRNDAPPCEARPSGIASSEFRDAMALLTTGVSIVATDGTHGMAGLTCSAICSVTDSPTTVLACVHARSSANALIKRNGVLAISCLGAGQRAVAELFAGFGKVPMPERFRRCDWHTLQTGAPCLAEAPMVLDCRLVSAQEIGTHSVLMAIVEAVHFGSKAEPLVYHGRSFATTRSI